jgi:PAS domain S-box-containing protein
MRKTVLDGKTWTGTYQSYKKGGEKFWQRISHYPLFENGETTHVLSIGEDISKKIEFEEDLKVSKENYEHIAQNAPGGIFIVSKTGNILYANKKASEITGYSNNEIIMSSIEDLVHPQQVSEIYEKLDSRLNGQEIPNNYEVNIVTKGGEIRNLEVSGTTSKWKGEVVDLIIVYDITLKTRFSNLLKIQNQVDYMSTIPMGLDQSFKEIFKTLFQFNWIDGGGIYLMNNAKKELNLVYAKGVSSKFKTQTKRYGPDSDEFRLIEQKRTTYLKEVDLAEMPKELIEEGLKSLLAIPLIHDNKVIGCLNLASKMHSELTENEKLIFEAIANRIAQMIKLILTQEELQYKNQKLQETLVDIQEKQQLLIQKSKLESLGELAAGVAHEINQPLGIISLSLENVLYKVSSKKASQEYLSEKFNSIFNNIKKIEEIIDHIRTFSRDQRSIIIERIDINKVIKRAYSLISEQYTFYEITVALNLGDDAGFTLGNNHKLEQVIINLFSNAKFALNEKADLLSEMNFKKQITITTFKEQNMTYLIFEDNGTGIEKEQLEKVFNPFYTTKPEGSGTGLGLSIVYGIIAEMKGKISIESQKNEYTKVKIELPTHLNEKR